MLVKSVACMIIGSHSQLFTCQYWVDIRKQQLTVRLSRSSCMMSVLSLYESSVNWSSSAMASSKAYKRTNTWLKKSFQA